ncbi:MAG: uracil-DNA glycosylase family protein [Pseudomonadota bacterium]|nr:MAG: uracil-DNA glycosylase [Pseudomonadota bacterium]
MAVNYDAEGIEGGASLTRRGPALPEPASLEEALARARACRLCAPHLPHEPRPVLRAAPSARVLIVGQAPGRKVHETGIPWNDPSGDLLRQWLDVDRETFYDERRIAIIPAGLCFPGKGPGGDLPPRAECAPTWHPRLRAHLPHIELVLLVGAYAHAYYLGARRKGTLADTVRAWREYLPAYFPLPHPSPRNRRWLKLNAWFEAEVIPELRRRFADVIRRGGTG